jgi:hypothetical protein
MTGEPATAWWSGKRWYLLFGRRESTRPVRLRFILEPDLPAEIEWVDLPPVDGITTWLDSLICGPDTWRLHLGARRGGDHLGGPGLVVSADGVRIVEARGSPGSSSSAGAQSRRRRPVSLTPGRAGSFGCGDSGVTSSVRHIRSGIEARTSSS